MNPLKSGMWKSTKFVQWAVMSAFAIIIFIFIFVPAYREYLEVLKSMDPLNDAYDRYLGWFVSISDWINTVLLVALSAMGGGNLYYGVLNQVQKRSATEIIKAKAKHGAGKDPEPEDENKYEGFTGIRMDRSYMKDRTLSDAWVYKDGNPIWEFVTLELPWNNNAYQDSCVPPGRYPVVKEHSPKFGEILPELKDVPNRSECKFHVANYPSELLGCIAPGLSFGDLDEDGLLDVANSRKALDKLMSLTPGSFEVIINGDV